MSASDFEREVMLRCDKHATMPAVCPVQAPTHTSGDSERDLAMWMRLVEVYAALDIQACRCELPHGTIQLLGGKASRCHCMEEINPWNLAY